MASGPPAFGFCALGLPGRSTWGCSFQRNGTVLCTGWDTRIKTFWGASSPRPTERQRRGLQRSKVEELRGELAASSSCAKLQKTLAVNCKNDHMANVSDIRQSAKLP